MNLDAAIGTLYNQIHIQRSEAGTYAHLAAQYLVDGNRGDSMTEEQIEALTAAVKFIHAAARNMPDNKTLVYQFGKQLTEAGFTGVKEMLLTFAHYSEDAYWEAVS